ncbi:unnamed protein product [Fraxinus pennsylvanica]|uniref:Uncharacterized protein n=1 Tax=Fraxinus pennsylvanica TaxID=56036 RepID=A0AAD2A478_9LAMI|nr:unnamed protein product [Fraxinus pennsylvanica]
MFRAATFMRKNDFQGALAEINRVLRFKLALECLELRFCFYLALERYQSATCDVQAILTLYPDYRMFDGRVAASKLHTLVHEHAENRTTADCWLQLYERWSSVDDIGSLSVIYQMLESDATKGVLYFRQSLLLLRYGFLLPENKACQDPLSASGAILQQFDILPEMYQTSSSSSSSSSPLHPPSSPAAPPPPPLLPCSCCLCFSSCSCSFSSFCYSCSCSCSYSSSLFSLLPSPSPFPFPTPAPASPPAPAPAPPPPPFASSASASPSPSVATALPATAPPLPLLLLLLLCVLKTKII